MTGVQTCALPIYYKYENPGKRGAYDIYTLGADGAEGGTGENADIGNWQ